MIADQLVAEMARIWELSPYNDPEYALKHDARRTAESLGYRRTGGSRVDGYYAEVYRHPDRPNEGVLIWLAGSAIRATNTTQHQR